MFLKLRSAKGCQGFGEKEVRNAGTVLLVVLNLDVQSKTRVATFDTNHSVTEGTQTINRCFSTEAS